MKDFDRLTEEVEAEETGSADLFPSVEPWPEHVDGAALLDGIESLLSRFIVADRATLEAATLWAAFTWCHENATVSPLAHISAPEKRCGKSLLLTCFSRLVCRPLVVSNTTSSALFRTVEKWQPCLLIDEADSFMRDNEDLRGVINSGFNRESAYVLRCVGDDHEPTPFATFSPKVICGIGNLPGTIMDRAIPLRLRRKKPNESAERLRHSDPEEWTALRARLARWAGDNAYRVAVSRPQEIDGLNDRAQDAWEPLQQIAAIAGGDWPTKAARAALALHGVEEDTPSIGAELLTDIKQLFEERRADKLFSADLLDALLADEEAPWPTWNRGKPMRTRQLSTRLAEFGIKSKQVRIGAETRKGYALADFSDAFERYISETPPDTNETPKQINELNGLCSLQSETQPPDVSDEEGANSLKYRRCFGVSDANPRPASHSDQEVL